MTDTGAPGSSTGPATPSVSVAMTTLNGGYFLREQLNSILAQSVLPTEIVIADDGSTDQTRDIIRAIARVSPIPIRVVGADHVGLLANVERALSACVGDVIVLADQDDRWHRDKVSSVVSAMTDPAVWLWFSDADLIDDHGAPIGPPTLWSLVHWDAAGGSGFSDSSGFRRLLHGGTVTGATMALRRELLAVALPFPRLIDPPTTHFLHDGWLAVLGALLGRTYAEPRPLISYRRHAGQYTALVLPEPETSTKPSDRAAHQLQSDFERVRLVYDRLVERDALPLLRAQDRVVLQEVYDLLATRTASPGLSRALSILRLARQGAYQRHTRGLTTAAADLVGLR